MTVGDLRAALEDFADEAEVRFASQPRWPLEYELSQVVVGADDDDGGVQNVYLTEGSQLGYLPESVGLALAEEGWGGAS